MNQSKFTRSDGWLLFTLSRTYQSLRNIISSGDHYNHAIFTYDELNLGLTRLIQNGYAEQSDNKFRITKKGKGIKRSHFFGDSLTDMINLSDKMVLMESEIQVDYSNPIISIIDYESAKKRYLG